MLKIVRFFQLVNSCKLTNGCKNVLDIEKDKWTFWPKKLMISAAAIHGLIVTKRLWVKFEIYLIGVATNTLGLFNTPTTPHTHDSVSAPECHNNIIIASLRLPNTSHLTEPPKSSRPKAWNHHLLTHQIFIWVNLHVVSHQRGGATSWFVVSWHTVPAWCCAEGLRGYVGGRLLVDSLHTLHTLGDLVLWGVEFVGVKSRL